MNPLALAQAIVLLEPLVQKGLSALIEKLHTKQMTPEQFIAEAEKLMAAQ